MFPPLFLSTRCATLDLHNYAHKFARAQMLDRSVNAAQHISPLSTNVHQNKQNRILPDTLVPM